MPLIRNAQHEESARRATVLDLGDLQRQAEAMAQQARAQVESMLADGRAERERLLAGAAEEGRCAGHAAGLAKGLEEGRQKGREEALAQTRATTEALVKSWSEALSAFEVVRLTIISDARADVLKLAAAIASRVVKRVVELDPVIVADQLDAAMRLVMSPTRLIVRVHPDDLATAHAVMPKLIQRLSASSDAEITGDPEVSRGSCIVMTDKGRIDASIESQLDRMVEALLPGQAPKAQVGAPAASIGPVGRAA
jgi:flagellar biosynthesis/type III secretory pathway protein FliH